MFLKYRKHYCLVRLAEYIRKCFRVAEDEGNLIPDCTGMQRARKEAK